ncbi:hypothetical protein ACFO8O_13125 [Hephaestia sp. GCM10023244]|uniref:hypothetical protein n=1 Tax=unclassified Hephaestia TaxID=2631281 RepID=UPI002077301C|nr:hypothetical protein [Hephaestia sp. MAHUQ-44]MCM8731903.1 hypothetical protein [Hephaestia sp. MAHUQ-44]
MTDARPHRLGTLIVIALGVLVVIGVIAWAVFGRATPGGPAPVVRASPVPLVSASPPSPSVASPEQLAAAVKAVWPAGTTLQDEDSSRYAFDTQKLVLAPFGPVLVSEGQADDAPHAAAGRLDIAYLTPEDDGFAVAQRFPRAIEIGSFGHMTDWSISDAFADTPVIVAEGGFTGQGYTCGATILTQLTAAGPVELAQVRMVYDDTGARGEEGQSFTGRITQIERGQGFTVHYTGAASFDDRYVMKDGAYVLEGASRLPQC